MPLEKMELPELTQLNEALRALQAAGEAAHKAGQWPRFYLLPGQPMAMVLPQCFPDLTGAAVLPEALPSTGLQVEPVEIHAPAAPPPEAVPIPPAAPDAAGEVSPVAAPELGADMGEGLSLIHI